MKANQTNNNDRRDFLKSSLVTVTATVIGGSLINSFVSCKQEVKKDTSQFGRIKKL